MAVLAGDALRMELDAVDRQAAVAKALDGRVVRLGVDGEAVRDAVRAPPSANGSARR